MFKLIHLISLMLGILAFFGNTIFGVYIVGLKLSFYQFIPFLISIALLSVWITISFLTYFLVGIARFSNSDKIWDILTPSLIVFVYLLIGLIVLWSFQYIRSNI